MNIKEWIDCVLSRLFICVHYVDIMRCIITIDQLWRHHRHCIIYKYPNFQHHIQQNRDKKIFGSIYSFIRTKSIKANYDRNDF